MSVIPFDPNAVNFMIDAEIGLADAQERAMDNLPDDLTWQVESLEGEIVRLKNALVEMRLRAEQAEAALAAQGAQLAAAEVSA